ncbi:MAG: hypothetical protein Q8907_09395, partial [Bacteroidota bacterium]|nr:hypothetical protein [Bacteroidota bacterium]
NGNEKFKNLLPFLLFDYLIIPLAHYPIIALSHYLIISLSHYPIIPLSHNKIFTQDNSTSIYWAKAHLNHILSTRWLKPTAIKNSKIF